MCVFLCVLIISLELAAISGLLTLTCEPLLCSATQSVSHPVRYFINQLASQSTIAKSVSQLSGQLVNRPGSQSITEPVSQCDRRAAN